MPCAVESIVIGRLEDVPPDAAGLFAPAKAGPGVDGLYDSLEWYRLLLRTALPEGGVPGFVLIRLDGKAAALIALLFPGSGDPQALTSPYTCLYRPLLAPDLDAAAVTEIGAALAAQARDGAGLRLDALDAAWPPLGAFCRGLRKGGLVPLRFAHFGNWHDAVGEGQGEAQGEAWQRYLASRAGALRETIRRRGAKLARDKAFRFEMVRGGDALEPAIAAFETVYALSWKAAEPFADFNAEMMRVCADLDMLRLTVLWQGLRPVAVQYWVVANHTAQILKLAHDPQFDTLSPGTLLTAWTIARLLDEEGVRELDFGRGDDGYKRLWAGRRRQRIGIVAANPLRLHGLAMICRHEMGRLLLVLKRCAQRAPPG
jgi:hypothetical protein